MLVFFTTTFTPVAEGSGSLHFTVTERSFSQPTGMVLLAGADLLFVIGPAVPEPAGTAAFAIAATAALAARRLRRS